MRYLSLYDVVFQPVIWHTDLLFPRWKYTNGVAQKSVTLCYNTLRYNTLRYNTLRYFTKPPTQSKLHAYFPRVDSVVSPRHWHWPWNKLIYHENKYWQNVHYYSICYCLFILCTCTLISRCNQTTNPRKDADIKILQNTIYFEDQTILVSVFVSNVLSNALKEKPWRIRCINSRQY